MQLTAHTHATVGDCGANQIEVEDAEDDAQEASQVPVVCLKLGPRHGGHQGEQEGQLGGSPEDCVGHEAGVVEFVEEEAHVDVGDPEEGLLLREQLEGH